MGQNEMIIDMFQADSSSTTTNSLFKMKHLEAPVLWLTGINIYLLIVYDLF